MDSLDELLADLHSATSTMKTEQGNSSASSSSTSLPTQVYQVRPNSNTSPSFSAKYSSGDHKHMLTPSQRLSTGSGDKRNSNNSGQYRIDSDRYSAGSSGSAEYPAPPLPPPPSHYEYEEDTGNEPLYEPQQIVYNKDRNRSLNQLSPKPYSSTQQYPEGQSSLGANLNELDYLLQDLNSAQFMQEIGRSGSDNSVNSHGSHATSSTPRTNPKTSPTSVTFNTTISTTSPGNTLSPRTNTTGRASSATRELDELMDSLSQFKMNSSPRNTSPRVSGEPHYAQVDKQSSLPVTPSTPPQPKASELDHMLGSLESDMKGHGVAVSTKGLCGACYKPIVGQVITALGKIWHPEHFCCQSCKEELGTRSFFERDEMPYCEPCYHRLFAPLCGKCNQPILDKCVTAMDTTWHMECFTCDHCGRTLNDEGFHERDGRPYCRDDYFEIFAPKCGGCNLPIIEDFISTLSSHWHTQCFRCMECSTMLAGGSFYDHDGMPYCETHYYAKRGSLCAGCQKPITGRCITAMFRKFHPEHFVCAFCLKQLNKGTFKEQNDKPYCHPCFVKLFG